MQGNKFEPISLHKYAFANLNPISNLDPTGNETLWDVSCFMACQAIITSIRCAVGLSLIGAGLGGIDALLGNDPYWPAVVNGAKWGGIIGLGWPFRTWRIVSLALGAVSGGYGSYSSFKQGKNLQGGFRIFISLMMLKACRDSFVTIERADVDGIEEVRNHLLSFGEMTPYDADVVSDLENGKFGFYERNFYEHELLEAKLMNEGLSYDVAHKAALTQLGKSSYDLYSPEVISKYPDLFNNSWK